MMLTILLLLGLPLLSTVYTARSRSLEKNHFATLATGAGHLGATLYLLLTRQNPFPTRAWFGLDPLGSFFLLILSHTFFAVALYSPGFLQRMKKPEYHPSRWLYYPALNSYLLASTLVIVTQHFGLLWVVIELTTFSLVPLIYFYRSKESLEAVWKYLFLVSLGLVFLLIGILALDLATKGAGEHASLVVSDLVRDAAKLDPLWVKTGFVLALVGISAKIGLAPMHPADIDATSNAPGPVAALMAGSLRSTAILVLLRFYEVACHTSVRIFSQRLLVIAGAFSILVAAVYIWRSRDYKRLLAYNHGFARYTPPPPKSRRHPRSPATAGKKYARWYDTLPRKTAAIPVSPCCVANRPSARRPGREHLRSHRCRRDASARARSWR